MHTTTAAPPTEPKTISTWLLRTTQAIDINPQYADAYFNRGTIFETKGAYDLAIADFTQVIQTKPQDADAYLNRGLAYRAKEEIDNAIADYSKAIDLNPRYANALLNRGIAYQSKGDHDRAITDYTRQPTPPLPLTGVPPIRPRATKIVQSSISPRQSKSPHGLRLTKIAACVPSRGRL
jgi:regulator of sirC expression with transglutaminase-like and TPR domain